MIPKLNPWRCPTYLSWVRAQPSALTGLPADDAHHIKGHGWSGTIKADDWATFPLTRAEHAHLHTFGWKTWEEGNGSQLVYVAKTLGRAIDAGVLVLK